MHLFAVLAGFGLGCTIAYALRDKPRATEIVKEVACYVVILTVATELGGLYQRFFN
jgi:hypothetical protein